MNDLDRILALTSADERLAERLTTDMDEDRRAVLRAAIETRGDVAEMARRLAPHVVQRARARSSGRATTAIEVLAAAPSVAWPAAGSPAPDQIAVMFLERYGVRLSVLTERAGRAAALATGAAAAARTIEASQRVTDALATLEGQLAELEAVATACAHPEGASMAEHGRTAAREALETAEAARALRSAAGDLRARGEAVAGALRAWAEAPEAERASTAASLETHLAAAVTVVAGMRDELAGLALPR